MKTTFRNYDKYFKNFGKNLLIYRTEAGLSQEKLGRKLGYSQSTICSIEWMYKDRHATIDFILQACEFFGVDINDMFEKPKKKAFNKAIKKSEKIEAKAKIIKIAEIVDEEDDKPKYAVVK